MVVELNRRLVKGYTKYRDDPRIVSLKKAVLDYHKSLMALNIRDHQLEYAKLSVFQVLTTLVYRLGKLIILSAAVLPGLVLFAPVFIAGKVISIRKAKEALAASTVKIQARDVVATWKLLVSMALAPTLYTYYTVILTFWTYYNRVQGFVPHWVSLWLVVVFGYIFFPGLSFAALRFGEIGMDIAKSLRPLLLSLNPSSGNTLVKLRKKRVELATEVTNLINELGPEMFPDFESRRILHPGEQNGLRTPDSPSRGRSWGDLIHMPDESPSTDSQTAKASIGGASTYSGHLPRNDSFKNLATIGLFSSRPQTPTSGHSRSTSRSQSRNGGFFGSNSFTMKSFSSTVDSKEALEDVSKKIRGAMQERGQKRWMAGEPHEHDSGVSSGVSTPGGMDGDGLSMSTKKNS